MIGEVLTPQLLGWQFVFCWFQDIFHLSRQLKFPVSRHHNPSPKHSKQHSSDCLFQNEAQLLPKSCTRQWGFLDGRCCKTCRASLNIQFPTKSWTDHILDFSYVPVNFYNKEPPEVGGARWVAAPCLQRHKQHHVHIMDSKGVRQPLNHCRDPKDPTKCKANFPREKWLAEKPYLVCPELAKKNDMPQKGKKSMVGMPWGPCNDPNLNGTHPALLCGLRCNSFHVWLVCPILHCNGLIYIYREEVAISACDLLILSNMDDVHVHMVPVLFHTFLYGSPTLRHQETKNMKWLFQNRYTKLYNFGQLLYSCMTSRHFEAAHVESGAGCKKEEPEGWSLNGQWFSHWISSKGMWLTWKHGIS